MQTLSTEQYEILVVDNASSDDTAEVVQALAGEVGNLRYVLERRSGLSHARNRALREARGPLVAFLDDDAIASRRWLEALLDAYVSGDDVVAVGGRTFLGWPRTRPGWLPAERDRFYGSFDLGDERRAMRFPIYPFGANMAISREALVAVGGFAPQLGRRGRSLASNEERFAFRKLAEAGGIVVYEPTATVRHNVLADRVNVSWVLRRSFAQGCSNVLEQALVEPSSPRRLWLYSAGRNLYLLVIQPPRHLRPTRVAVVRAASRASLRLGSGWQSMNFAFRPPEPPGSHDVGPTVVSTTRPLRVAARPGGLRVPKNPYTVLLEEAVANAGATTEALTIRGLLVRRYDIVHLHWPESGLLARPGLRAALRAMALLSAIAIARCRGARVVWTVHNLVAHEKSDTTMSRLLWSGMVALIDGVISLTRGGVDLVQARFPRLRGKPTFAIPHGHYIGHYRDVVTRDEARTELRLGHGHRVILFFGQIRPYKGVPSLLRAFSDLKDPAARLLVAGRPSTEGLRGQVVMAAGDDDRIHINLQFVPSERVELYFRAADLVVLPFCEVFNSGSAVLALSFDRPILVPALPVFEELAADVGLDWVRTYRGELNAATLALALSLCPPAGQPVLEGLAWPRIGEETVAAYRALVTARAGRRG